MNEALLKHIPNRILEVVIKNGLQHKGVVPFQTKRWSDELPDASIYKELIELYFPDETEALKPTLENMTEDECKVILLQGIPFRYGHLEGVQKDYMLSVLAEDYQNQEKFLKENPSECLTTNYVASRAEDPADPYTEFRHVSEIAASKNDAKALFLMLNAYKQLCEQDNDHMYSSKFFQENYNEIREENAFLRESRVKLGFINLEKIADELSDMAMLESFDSIADIGDADKLSEIKKKKEQLKERRKELAKSLIKSIKAITQKKFPADKKYSQREWPFVDFNQFYNFYMKNGLDNAFDNGNDFEPPKPK